MHCMMMMTEATYLPQVKIQLRGSWLLFGLAAGLVWEAGGFGCKSSI
jgi:hypothetical protein